MYKIITPPTTEPVTLAEVRMALRLNSTDFADNVASVQSIAPGSHNIAASYSLLGTGVDVLGTSAVVLLSAGTNGTGGTVDIKIQESDDNITFTDWTGGSFTQVTEANDNTTYEKSYTGTKQYIRVACTVAVAACSFGVSVLKEAATNAEDTLLENYITTAREHGEACTGRAFTTQTVEQMMLCFPGKNYIELLMPPVQSITSVKYKDANGVEYIMATTTEYIADTDNEPARIVLPYSVSWPSATLYTSNPIRIRYVTGYYASNPIPKMLKSAMLLHVGLLYKYRDEAMPADALRTVNRLYDAWKVGWL
jgi:uncharacterized phiE125 gp8 family phage protein